MVTRLDTAQPSNHNTDANFPHGAPRNNISPDDKTGTKWNETWVKDLEALKQGMIITAGVTPSGTPDTALSSQWLTALKTLTVPTAWVATATGAINLSGVYPWARGARIYLIGAGGGSLSGAYLQGGAGGGSGGIRVYDLTVSDGFDWTFTVANFPTAGTGGASPTAGGAAGITLANGTVWYVAGGSQATLAGGFGHCGGGGSGDNSTPGGNGGRFGDTSIGTGSAGTAAGGSSAATTLNNLFLMGWPVSPQKGGDGGTGTAGNGGGGGGGHLSTAKIAVDGDPGDSGVNSGGKAGYGFGAGAGGGGGTNGAFLGAGKNAAPGLIMAVPF